MSTSTEVAHTEKGIGGLVATYQADFAAVLPSHIKPASWVRLAQGALRRDPKLARAANNNPAALMVALLDAARLGLEPGSTEYYLTPRKVKGQEEILGIVGYRGEIELIYRAGAVSSVVVEAVYSGDTFTFNPGQDVRPQHIIGNWFGDRGQLVGSYAYAVMKDGATSKVIVIGPKEIAIAKASSQGSDSPYSPWVKHPESMYLKTAVHRLAKFVPTSAEYRREILRAATEVAAESQPAGFAPAIPDLDVDAETGEVYDAEVVEETP